MRVGDCGVDRAKETAEKGRKEGGETILVGVVKIVWLLRKGWGRLAVLVKTGRFLQSGRKKERRGEINSGGECEDSMVARERMEKADYTGEGWVMVAEWGEEGTTGGK